MPLFSRQRWETRSKANTRQDDTALQPLPLLPLLLAWLSIGGQSFGGGSSTLFLIRRVIVEQRGWVSDDEVTKAWAICQIVPGINLLALTTLLGWRLSGAWGVVAALGGLLVPSVTLTIVATAIYRSMQHLNVIQAALRGIIPATIGLGILMSWQLAHPLLRSSRAENWQSLALSIKLLVGTALAVVVLRVPIVLVLGAAGLCGAFGYHWLNRNKPTGGV